MNANDILEQYNEINHKDAAGRFNFLSNHRHDWNGFFMQRAWDVSTMSTCARLNVGGILVKRNRIKNIAYNGVPSEHVHCRAFFEKYHHSNLIPIPFDEWVRTEEFRDVHAKFSEKHEIHCESNLIAGIDEEVLNGANVYLTCTPCLSCSKLLIAAKIKRLFYDQEYDRGNPQEVIGYLRSAGIDVHRIQV